MEQKKDFTGVWVPKQIIENKELTLLEKMLYAEIACFDDCFASNEFFAEKYNVSKEYISKSINKLIKLGFIIKISFDGRRRIIRAKHIDSLMQSNNKVLGRVKQNINSELNKSLTINKKLKNNLNNNLSNKLDKLGEAPDEVKRLYYLYLKQNQIPIANNNVLRSKIKEMKELYGEKWCIDYLNFMLKQYQHVESEYKPVINNALDLYTKSKAIQSLMIKITKEEEIY